jgi:OFA family oxalate/formate antiporter-like MFS transporter
MAGPIDKVPTKAWVVTFAGTAVNLCLGILYAWSVWKAALLYKPDHPAGSAMTGINEGWVYLTDAQATWAYAICGIVFACFMIPGGRIQDKYGPKVGATTGGLLLAAGCIISGLMKSYTGLVIGFGILGGMGMGIGYAAPTPAAVKWFGPHKRGLIVGLVVGGYGGAALYISPLAKWSLVRTAFPEASSLWVCSSPWWSSSRDSCWRGPSPVMCRRLPPLPSRWHRVLR